MMCMNMIELALAASRVQEPAEISRMRRRQGQGPSRPCTTRMGARAQLTDPVRLERLVEYDQSSRSELEGREDVSSPVVGEVRLESRVRITTGRDYWKTTTG